MNIFLLAKHSIYKETFVSFVDSVKEDITVFTQESNPIDDIDVLLIRSLDMTRSRVLNCLQKYSATPVFVLSDELKIDDLG